VPPSLLFSPLPPHYGGREWENRSRSPRSGQRSNHRLPNRSPQDRMGDGASKNQRSPESSDHLQRPDARAGVNGRGTPRPGVTGAGERPATVSGRLVKDVAYRGHLARVYVGVGGIYRICAMHAKCEVASRACSGRSNTRRCPGGDTPAASSSASRSSGACGTTAGAYARKLENDCVWPLRFEPDPSSEFSLSGKICTIHRTDYPRL
jgi:hypothetical protein